MKTYNLKESLIQMDRETDFKYTLTDLYEACQLTEDKKRELVKYIDAKDPVGMNAMLCNEVGVMTENVSDDIPDDEMPELEGWSPNMSECPACGDFTFNPRSGRCNACSYHESLTEAFQEGDMVWVKPSKKPGRVVSVKDDVVEVEIQGGNDSDRKDTFYPSDLELQDRLEESRITSTDPMVKFKGKSSHTMTKDKKWDVDFDEDGNIQAKTRHGKPYYFGGHINDKTNDTPQNDEDNIIAAAREQYALKFGGTNLDRRDTFYASDLEKEDRMEESGALAALGAAAATGFGQAVGDKVATKILGEDVNTQNLEATLRAAAETKLAEMGYEGDFIDEYFGIKLEDTEDNRVKVTVWGELSYEESSELADVLNYIVAEEDPEAYFDHETTGRIVAYIRKDQSEDIPDEALVTEWSEKFNACSTWEELKDVYGEFYNIRDDLNNGTHRALYDIIDKKIDELKPVEESLTEDAEETPAAIYSMLDASDSYVDNDDYPEGASEEEIIKIAEANPDCMKVTKWVDGMEGPDEVIWERPVDTWYVSKYEGGAEYEHTEGGYYYETLTHVDKETFDSKEAAQKRLAELADEARKEGEDVVAQTDDFFRIKTGKYIGDCEEYRVEAKEGAYESGKKIYEGLNEAILNEMDSTEEKPYSATEVQRELKSLTQNFTRKKDTLKCGFKEENDVAVKLLKKHYKNVASEKRGQWFEITFNEPIEELKESINTYNVTFYMDSLDDNVMSGPTTTKKIQAASEEEAKKKLMDSSTDKYYIPTIVKIEQINEAIEMTADEMKAKHGTDNPDIINAGKPDEERVALKEQMIYTDVDGFIGEPGKTYTMSQFRRMWQDKDNDPIMSNYDSFEEWVGETISQMDASEEQPEVAPSGRGMASCKIWKDTNGVMGTPGEEYTLNDLADYWTNNNGSDPILAEYKGDWKAWLDATIPQMEERIDDSLYCEGLESKTFTDKEEAKKFAKDNKGAITSVVDDKLNPTHYVHYKGKKEPVNESFEDMLKDPEVQRRNAEYADKMKAKYDKENELAKEAKNWPDDKVLTYEEALALAKAYYAQGGDSFYETTEKYQFDDEVEMFGPMTVGRMKKDFGVYDSIRRDRMGDDVL